MARVAWYRPSCVSAAFPVFAGSRNVSGLPIPMRCRRLGIVVHSNQEHATRQEQHDDLHHNHAIQPNQTHVFAPERDRRRVAKADRRQRTRTARRNRKPPCDHGRRRDMHTQAKRPCPRSCTPGGQHDYQQRDNQPIRHVMRCAQPMRERADDTDRRPCEQGKRHPYRIRLAVRPWQVTPGSW